MFRKVQGLFSAARAVCGLGALMDAGLAEMSGRGWPSLRSFH